MHLRSSPPATRFGDDLATIAAGVDGFIVDQWGVLHDGTRPYPGVRECLARLRALGKPVVVLSNSGKRSAENVERMRALGLPPQLYTTLITSGEVVWRALADRRDPELRDLGRRCIVITRGGDRSLIDGLDLQPVADAATADFVLLGGVDEDPQVIAAVEALLARAADRRLPLLCANPDAVGICAEGTVVGPGSLAQGYARRGGRVRAIGKPYPEVYEVCRESMPGMAVERILAIGDSLAHDVAGAAAIGCRTVLVTCGIHAADFADDAAAESVLPRLAASHGVAPDWVIPAFRW